MASRNRGRKKPNLRDFSRLPPTEKELLDLRDDLTGKQPPIVAAILGQSLLEAGLDELLRPHFSRRDDETWAELTGDTGPLSTFHSKIIAAYAFGICSPVVRDALNSVRQIRNAFAHSKKPLDFSHQLITNKLKAVTLPAGKRTKLYQILSGVRKTAKSPNPKGAQASYVLLCLAVESQLLKKQTARAQAQYRRFKRSPRYQLAQALMRFQSE